METQKHTKLYLLVAWMAIVPLVSSVSITYLVLENESVIESFSIGQWFIFYCVSTLTMALAITPTTYIALFSGYFLGLSGIVPIIISYQMASFIGYFIARKFDDGFIDLIITKYPKAKKITENVHHNQFALAFLSRLSPALPFAIMNIVMSISKIRLSQFLFGGLVGMLPRTLFFIWVGYKTSQLSDALDENMNIYWSIGASLIIVWIIYKIIKKQ